MNESKTTRHGGKDMRRIIVAAQMLCAIISTHDIHAATWYVATNGSDSASGNAWATAKASIQAGVNVAVGGDTVWVSNGLYTSGSLIVYGALPNRVAITNAITVRSLTGPSATTIQGGGSTGNDAVRCVYVGSNATLSGFTLTSGRTRVSGDGAREQSGGGAWCEQTGVISNCVLRNNAAYVGGGGVYGGTAISCLIESNSLSGGNGGGARQSLLIDCVLSGNGAYYSGGGAAYSTLRRCTLSNNHSSTGGGGASLQCDLEDSLITGNTAAGNGGGTALGVLNRCRVMGNTAWSYGGSKKGGGCWSNTLNNCLLANNSGNYGGGAYGSTLNNCTVANNWAQYGGGADSSIVNNSIVYYNTATTSGSNGFGCTWTACCTSPDRGGDNISSEPQFINASAVNYHLHANSPCVDMGSNAFAQGAADLDGGPRIVNTRVDVGAYEFREEAALPSFSNSLPICNWHVSTGATYRVERTKDLQNPTWTNLSGVFTAMQPAISIPDPDASDKAFYRCVYVGP
jgi:hypothetical protein